MRSELPKVLHDLCGTLILTRVLDLLREIDVDEIVVVLADRDEAAARSVDLDDVTVAVQQVPRGTGDALLQARDAISRGQCLILPGDLPLLSAQLLRDAVDGHRASGADLTVLSAEPEDPGRYGRILRDDDGHPLRVVEAADATGDQLAIREVNTGIYLLAVSEAMWTLLEGITPENAQGEFYLTDLVAAYAATGKTLEVTPIEPAARTMGINTRADLAAAARFLYREAAMRCMDDGATLIDPDRTYIDSAVQVGRDVVIFPDTHLRGATAIGDGTTIGPGAWIEDSRIESGCRVIYSTIEGSIVREGTQIGPYAHLRPGADIGPGCRVGNFVEVKAARLERGVKAGHLSYIGDADVGEETNIGAGTVTCNFDGREKHRTQIGRNAFVGSNTSLVAPVTVGEDAVIAAGSTITEDVPQGATAFGRARQTNKAPGQAAEEGNCGQT